MDNTQLYSVFKQRAIWSFVTLFTGWAGFYWSILSSLVHENSCIWVLLASIGIIAVSLYLISVRKKLLVRTHFTSSQIGLFCLFFANLFFIISSVFNIQIAEQSLVILMLPFLTMTSFGFAVSRILFFPLVYLLLIVPLFHYSMAFQITVIVSATLIFIIYLRYLKFYRPGMETAEQPIWTLEDSRWLGPTAVAFVMLMVSPWLADNIRAFYPIKEKSIFLSAPLGTGIWRGPYIITGKEWEPSFLNASASLQVEYYDKHDEQKKIYVYAAYYNSERAFNELLSSQNVIYKQAMWRSNGLKIEQINLGDNVIELYIEILQTGNTARLTWYWYYVAGVNTIDVHLAELLDKVRIISKYAQGSGVVVLSTSYNTAMPEEASIRLTNFLKTMYNSLDSLKRPEIVRE